MHKQIHFERTIAMDETLHGDSSIEVRAQHKESGAVKKISEISFTIPSLFAQINKTWQPKLDFYDTEAPFRSVPVAFQTNEYLLMYLATYMRGVRESYDGINRLSNITAPHRFDDGGMLEVGRLDAEDVLTTLAPRDDYEATLISTMVHEYWAMYSFWMNNERVYKVSSGLVDGLTETEYPAKGNSLRSPHDTLYLLLPTDKPFKLPATERMLEGIYVSYIRNPSSDWVDGSILSCYMAERPRSMGDIKNPRSHYFNLRIDHDKKLDKIISAGVLTLAGMTSTDVIMNKKNNVLEQLVPIVRLVVNSLLYMTSTNADIIPMPPPSEKDVDDKRMRKFAHRVKSRKKYSTLGSDIIIKRNGQETANMGMIGTGTKHSYRYEVRAHFSHYWILEENLPENITPDKITGEKTNEFGEKKYRIRTWVDKHMRGDEMAEVILKDYKLEE